MVVCAHLQRVYHWMVTTQTTFCGRKRRLRTEPGSTALTVADVGFAKALGGCFSSSRASLSCNPLSKILHPPLENYKYLGEQKGLLKRVAILQGD